MSFTEDPNTLPAKSLHQPYASLVAAGLKTLETRKTRIHYRGPLVICSTLRDHESAHEVRCMLSRDQYMLLERLRLYPWGGIHPDLYGFALCVVDVVGCRQLLPEDEPWSWFYAEGRFAWELANVRRVRPLPVRGSQGFFRVPKAALEYLDV